MNKGKLNATKLVDIYLNIDDNVQKKILYTTPEIKTILTNLWIVTYN